VQADPVALLFGAREGEARSFEAPGLPVLALAGHRAAYLARVRPLGEDARRLLLLAAADDTGDVGTVLRAASALGVPTEAIDAAERADLLSIEAERLRLHHPLVRSAVYRAASFGERREAQEALAVGLDSHADADRAAWHRAVVATAPDDEVAEALTRTADRAQRRGCQAAAARRSSAGGSAGGRRVGARDVGGRGRAAPREGHLVLADAAREVLSLDRVMGLDFLGLACVAAAMGGEWERLAQSYQLAAAVDPDPDSDKQVFLVRLLGGLGEHPPRRLAACAALLRPCDPAGPRADGQAHGRGDAGC
jgi:hypothetical protein